MSGAAGAAQSARLPNSEKELGGRPSRHYVNPRYNVNLAGLPIRSALCGRNSGDVPWMPRVFRQANTYTCLKDE